MIAETADLLADFGVSRVSLGIQSFSDRKLTVLERDHRADRIAQAIQVARQRFASVAVDLIFGVPGESLAEWHTDLQRTIASGAHHVSAYGLTFEKGAAFWSRLARGELQRLDEDLEATMYESAIDILAGAEFEHYEISNFALPGHRCRHNETYWRSEPYYAAGPGASRFVDGWRETNHRSTTTYLARVLSDRTPVVERERLAPEDAARERLVFGLRMVEGIDRQQFSQLSGFTPEQVTGSAIGRLREAGLLEDGDGIVRLTRKGLMLSDCVSAELLRGAVL
jgi:oxygen-independent coproporphyrinogen-3 oxidase